MNEDTNEDMDMKECENMRVNGREMSHLLSHMGNATLERVMPTPLFCFFATIDIITGNIKELFHHMYQVVSQ